MKQPPLTRRAGVYLNHRIRNGEVEACGRAAWIGTRVMPFARTLQPPTGQQHGLRGALTRGLQSSRPRLRKTKDGLGDLIPYWMYPGDAHLQRRVMALPLSRDQKRWKQLQDSLALYRLAFGQPRQEDMVAAPQRRGIVEQPERIAEIRIDLRPPALGAGH